MFACKKIKFFAAELSYVSNSVLRIWKQDLLKRQAYRRMGIQASWDASLVLIYHKRRLGICQCKPYWIQTTSVSACLVIEIVWLCISSLRYFSHIFSLFIYKVKAEVDKKIIVSSLSHLCPLSILNLANQTYAGNTNRLQLQGLLNLNARLWIWFYMNIDRDYI